MISKDNHNILNMFPGGVILFTSFVEMEKLDVWGTVIVLMASFVTPPEDNIKYIFNNDLILSQKIHSSSGSL